MTDKTPRKKVENLMNTQAALAKTTDTARDSEPKSRALPQADALKARFKAGSIPLQTDFADLIDLANIGRQAVGGAKGQSGPANGFTLSSDGRLELKPNAAKGISVDQDGLAIKLKTISGLTMDKDGVSVKPKADSGIELKDSAGISLKPGNGISVDNDGIAVKAEGNKGLQVTNNGVSVKPGNGIAANSSGVNVKLSKGYYHNGGGGNGENGSTSGPAGGLNLDSNGLSVNAGNGIQIDPKGVSIKLAANSGLSVDETNGLKIVPKQMFQKGMVMMFAGTAAEIPEGWALCDGSPGMPNLIDRFILGSKPADSGKFNSATLSGSGNKKVYSKESSSETVFGTISIGSTTLTENQIPSHKHIDGMPYYSASYNKYGYVNVGGGGKSINDDSSFFTSDSVPRNPYTSSTGRGEGHTHTGTMSTTVHKHTTDVIPPYYTLAFIIKL